ncbi:phosphatase PAP2 family protein [Methylocella sp.]|uniref:phosphatase PAP2 family protein n=1 Tax=Methylocella sp. TaxID=1978226 RepID=UPI00378474BE
MSDEPGPAAGFPVAAEANAVPPGRCARAWARSKRGLSSADLGAVRFFSRAGRWRVGRGSAALITRLGDGWLYPILALMIVAHFGAKAPRVILAAGLNAGLLHCLYPTLKRLIARPRPFHIDARLASRARVLDEHSFPSGHAMTLCGVLTPIVMAWPDCLSAAAALMALMGWARIATGHHYPSDVCAGVGLGLILSYPISVWALA